MAITDDCKATKPSPSSTTPAAMQHNRAELEIIFTRVGLQMTVASKLADEVYEKLQLPADKAISLADFLSLIHCNSESDTLSQQWPSKSCQTAKDTNTECTLNPINDYLLTDLHAASGLLFDSNFLKFIHAQNES